MNAILMLLLMAAVAPSADWTPVIAAEGAVVTMEPAKEPGPAPQPAPDAGSSAGPIDTFRDAKALIEKGNALADRGKAVLDQAQRDGKITVDIRLPTPPAAGEQTQPQTVGPCPGGVCPLRPPAQPSVTPAETAQPTPQRSGGYYQPRLFWRWRR